MLFNSIILFISTRIHTIKTIKSIKSPHIIENQLFSLFIIFQSINFINYQTSSHSYASFSYLIIAFLLITSFFYFYLELIWSRPPIVNLLILFSYFGIFCYLEPMCILCRRFFSDTGKNANETLCFVVEDFLRILWGNFFLLPFGIEEFYFKDDLVCF